MIFWQLFYEFFGIGLFSIGGGLATIPFLYDLSARTGWFTSTDIVNMLAISESTPGAIGLNMATFAGYLTGGVSGAVLATLALTLPSILVILIIAKGMRRFQDSPLVGQIFYGLRPASLGLITVSAVTVIQVTLLNTDAFTASGNIADLFVWKSILLAAVIFLARKKLNWHPVVFIGLAAVAGIVFSM